MKKVFDLLHSIRKFYWRTFNVKTFGVRVIISDDKKIFLVKHRYGNLWVLPGGGIKREELAEDAAKREVFEETNIKILSLEKILGEYKNDQEGKDDTVTVFVAQKWNDCGRKWNWEIKESGFFDLKNLPDGVSSATKRRISEYITGSVPMLKW